MMVLDDDGRLLEVISEEELNGSFADGYYLGSQREAKKHWLYLAAGIFLGSIGSIAYWIDYLVK